MTMVRSEGPAEGSTLVSATTQSTPMPFAIGVPLNAWATHPSLSVCDEAEAVSQISLDRKCERLG